MGEGVEKSKYGSIISNTIRNVSRSKPKKKDVAILLKKNIVLKGKMKVKCEVNSEEVYGIEIESHFPFCFDNRFKYAEDFFYEKNFIIIMEKSMKFVELDGDGFVKTKEDVKTKAGKYKGGDIVLVLFKDICKAAQIKRSVQINDIPCHEIEFEEGCEKIVLDNDVICKLLDDDGFVCDTIDELHLEQDKSVLNKKIGDTFEINDFKGKLRWMGTVNGLDCVGLIVKDNEKLSDFTKFTNIPGSYWTMIPLGRPRDDPQSPPPDDIKEDECKPPASSNDVRKVETVHTNRAEIDQKYEIPLSIIEHLGDQNVQINISERPLYSIVNAMFTFSEMFDSLIFDNYNDNNKELRKYLAEDIVIPIRRNKIVQPDIWKSLIEKCFDDKSETDYSGFFRGMLKKIDFNFQMINIQTEKDNKETILNLAISWDKPKSTKLKIGEILNLFCIENETFFCQPPKCIILGLPSNTGDKKIAIVPKLDITKLIVSCTNCCSVCSSDAETLCKECSTEKMDITYFCRDHKTHCKHNKCDIKKRSASDKNWKGKIELELYSIISRNQTSYHTYVKSNDVKGNWIHFSTEDKGCHVEKIDIQSYFTQLESGKKGNNKADNENLENHVVMCFYKFPPLEFYWNGF